MSNRDNLLSVISDLAERVKAEPNDPNLPRLLAEAEADLAALDAMAAPDTPHATVSAGGVARVEPPAAPPVEAPPAPVQDQAPAPVEAPPAPVESAPVAQPAPASVPASQAASAHLSTASLGTKLPRPGDAVTADFDPNK